MTGTTETYDPKGSIEKIWGEESTQELRDNTYGGKDARRSGARTGSQRIAPDREDSSARNWISAIGGILAQLIQDTEKQLGKSRECVAWYEAEINEYEEKLQNLKQLQELQENPDSAKLEETGDEECEEEDAEDKGI